MPSLEEILKTQIRETGPLTLEAYMQMALMHPEYGYYQSGKVFGASGDFTTAPEISQMFGELIGLWWVDSWVKMGSPAKFNLVELGPGNGALMSDALRSAALVPDFLAAAHIHLVETSINLRTVQQKMLSRHSISWSEDWPSPDPRIPAIVFGNEFLDALPIRQFEVKSGQWFERNITVNDDKLEFCLVPVPAKQIPSHFPDIKTCTDGDVAEQNPRAEKTVMDISRHLCRSGGVALFIDYGPAQTALGDSFQAVKRHKFVDPLLNPGSSDLTAHVDFQRLGELAAKNGCRVLPPASQGRFLERLGIEARALTLARQATGDQKEKIRHDLQRLTSSAQMGTLFKAMVFYEKMSSPPAGFGDT